MHRLRSAPPRRDAAAHRQTKARRVGPLRRGHRVARRANRKRWTTCCRSRIIPSAYHGARTLARGAALTLLKGRHAPRPIGTVPSTCNRITPAWLTDESDDLDERQWGSLNRRVGKHRRLLASRELPIGWSDL